MTGTKDQTGLAALLISSYAFIIGFTDNYVIVIAKEAGLWQFHLTRSAMVAGILLVLVPILRLQIWPTSWFGVTARSAIHGLAMIIYFGALAFLDVALVAAGLFTAPIWVLLINRLIYGRPITGLQIGAVTMGFAGVVMVLGPSAIGGASLAAVLPVLAGALYAMGNVATREWCAQESALTIVTGFFVALGIIGIIGMTFLTIFPNPVPQGAEYFLTRGPVVQSGGFWFWTFVQAAGSLLGVGMMIRAYQLTEAARASVLEYVILPCSAFWTYVIWGKGLDPLAIFGMILIAGAGGLIAFSGRRNNA